MEWKWSNGGKYEKSLRIVKKEIQIENLINKTNENFTINQCLLSEEESKNLEEILQKQQGIYKDNRREESYNRMSEREMFGQIGMNPFLSNNNYINDLMMQENFMKPKNTNSEREKEFLYE